MKIYLAARYGRRVELAAYRDWLQALGHTVTARWLDGTHQVTADGRPLGDDGEALVEGDDGSDTDHAAWLRARFAAEDLDDISESDYLIAFTESAGTGHSRGGRHVELGFALALGIPVHIIGPRENIFCWLEDVVVWDSMRALIESGELGWYPETTEDGKLVLVVWPGMPIHSRRGDVWIAADWTEPRQCERCGKDILSGMEIEFGERRRCAACVHFNAPASIGGETERRTPSPFRG